MGSIPGSGRSPGEGNGNSLQYSCLENAMGRGAWQATVHGVAESDKAEATQQHWTTEFLNWKQVEKLAKSHFVFQERVVSQDLTWQLGVILHPMMLLSLSPNLWDLEVWTVLGNHSDSQRSEATEASRGKELDSLVSFFKIWLWLQWCLCLRGSASTLNKFNFNLLLSKEVLKGFPGCSAVKKPPAMQEMPETWFPSPGQEDPLEEEMVTHSSILAWKIPWTEEPVGYSPWGPKELDMTERAHAHTQRGAPQ